MYLAAILLAIEIYKWCKENELWEDTCIYFNDKAWATWSTWKGVEGKKIDENLYEYDNKNPKDYFECVADPHVLSMSFEGPLNHILNGYTSGCENYTKQFESIFNKHGFYYELGDSWNLTACEL